MLSGTGVSGEGKLALALAVFIVLAIVSWFTGLLDYLVVVLGLEKYFIDYANANVTGVEFDIMEKPYYKCRVEINSSHVIRTCHARRIISMIELETRYGRVELDHREIWSRWSISRVDCYRVEVADLVDQYYEVYELVNLTPMDLGVYRRLLDTGRFEYRWVDMSFYLPSNTIYPNPYDPREKAFRFYIAVFTYVDRECSPTDKYMVCNYTYAPASMEVAEEYARVGEETWCRVFEEFMGINCSFIPVDPTQYCTWTDKIVMEHREGVYFSAHVIDEYFPCRKVNNTHVIVVIEIPDIIPPGLRGINIYGRCIALKGGKYHGVIEETFVHELGHTVGLEDLYDLPSWYFSEPWMEQVVKDSTMMNGSTISIGDAVEAIYAAYHTIRVRDTELAQRIYERLLGYGINPENNTIILPLTEENRIPPPINSIIEKGVVDPEYDWVEDKLYWVFNDDILRLLKTIAQTAYSLETNTIVTP